MLLPILAVSTALQYVAAALAIRLVWLTERRPLVASPGPEARSGRQ